MVSPFVDAAFRKNFASVAYHSSTSVSLAQPIFLVMESCQGYCDVSSYQTSNSYSRPQYQELSTNHGHSYDQVAPSGSLTSHTACWCDSFSTPGSLNQKFQNPDTCNISITSIVESNSGYHCDAHLQTESHVWMENERALRDSYAVSQTQSEDNNGTYEFITTNVQANFPRAALVNNK